MKLELDLLDNGLDFIIEGLKPTDRILGNHMSDNKWKYSVLNIFSGIELVLKEKLKKEHWSLIFQDISSANKQKLTQGDFVSVFHSDVIKRLRDICNVSINDASIDALRKLRNKFEHFEINITIDECKQVIARALKDILKFIDDYILDFTTENQKDKINQIKSLLFDFDVFIENQFILYENAIKGIIDNNSGKLVHCRSCYNESFIIFKNSQKNYRCFVCDENISKSKFITDVRKKEKEDFENELSFLKKETYNYNCAKCGGDSRVKYSPGYFLVTTEYKPDYFLCLDCLHFETTLDIASEALEQEIAELEKTHSTSEIIKILERKLEDNH